MTGLASWWRTPHLKRNLVLIGLAPLLLLGLVLLSSGARPRPERRPPPALAPPAPSGATTSRPTATTAELSAQAVAAARPVAVAFLEAYASYRWDDPPDALRQRLRPYDTATLDASLAVSSGATRARDDLATRHQIAVGHVLELNPLAIEGDGRLRLTGLVRQQLQDDDGERATTVSVALLLVRTQAGWRVDQVEL